MDADVTNLTPKKARHAPTDWPTRFLIALRKYANVSAAAKTAGVSRETVYTHRGADPVFAAAWEDALVEATEGLEREAWRRAATGVTRKKGVWYEGAQVGTETTIEYSDTLLIFLLKAHAPAKYRETTRHEITGANGGAVQVARRPDLAALTTEDLVALEALVAKLHSQPSGD
jgi:hypothetical protein